MSLSSLGKVGAMPIKAKVIYEGFSDDGLETVRNTKELLKEHRLAHRFRPSAELTDDEVVWLIELLKAVNSFAVASGAAVDSAVAMKFGHATSSALEDRAERNEYIRIVLDGVPLR